MPGNKANLCPPQQTHLGVLHQHIGIPRWSSDSRGLTEGNRLDGKKTEEKKMDEKRTERE